MRNLYQALGFPGIVDDLGAIEAVLAKGALPPVVGLQARLVLLQPTRKARYDWVLRCELELVLARSRVGLSEIGRIPDSKAQPDYASRAPQLKKTLFRQMGTWLVGLLLLGGLAWWAPRPGKTEVRPSDHGSPSITPEGAGSAREAAADKKETPPAETGELRAFPPPRHGLIQGDSAYVLKVPWFIETDPGQDYFLTLRDSRTQAVALTLYLHGGEPYVGQAPEGEFELIYASGTRWFGRKQGFGPESRAIRSERIYRIQAGPDEAWVWNLRLQATTGEHALVTPVRPVTPSEPSERNPPEDGL